MPAPAREYGLILPNKKKDSRIPSTRTLNPLVNSDDELEKDEGEALNWVEASLKKSAGNSGQQSLQKRLLREAVEEDSTVFQYDEVYDDMKATQHLEQEKKRQTIQRKPKYIETILKHTEKRKLENERRLERKVQREREAEGNEFTDKESFVTPSYLKKLEELKQAEQAEMREKLIEEKLDVHKHKNFGVFYNHIYKQRVGDTEIKQEPPESVSFKNVNESNPSISNTHKNRQKNYRTQEDVSDEEYGRMADTTVRIKKEVFSSSNSEDEDSKSVKENKNKDHNIESGKNKSKESKTSSEVLRSDRAINKDQSRNKDRRSGSREKYKKIRDRNSKEDYHSRRKSHSKERSGQLREKSRRERSPDTGRRRRERSPDTSSRRETTRDNSRGERDRGESRDVNKREGSREWNKRKRSNERERENIKKKSQRDTRELSSENKLDGKNVKDKSRAQKTQDALGKKLEKAAKQSINTTLGATDINKMKTEDRIKRFSEVFAKRTVDQRFENAVQKYFQRKAERESKGLM